MDDRINILFIGDVVGEPGIDAVKNYLPELTEQYKPHCIIINGENADKGKGITEKEADILFGLGINIITSGNHIWENWLSKPLLAKNSQVLRPYNYPPGNAGMGFGFHKIDEETKVAVLNLQGRTFMQAINCPFKGADHAINTISNITNIIIVDFHADATAEKMSMAWHLDGRVSAIIGTHTHVPTADACILPQGTAYITDVGMTGPFDSVVGMRKDVALKRFILQTPHKYEMATGDVRICGVSVSVDKSSGKALSIDSFMLPQPRRIVE